VVDRSLLVEDTITLPVPQINGRKRGELTIAADASQAEVETATLALDAVQRALDGQKPRKIVVGTEEDRDVVVMTYSRCRGTPDKAGPGACIFLPQSQRPRLRSAPCSRSMPPTAAGRFGRRFGLATSISSRSMTALARNCRNQLIFPAQWRPEGQPTTPVYRMRSGRLLERDALGVTPIETAPSLLHHRRRHLRGTLGRR